MVMNAMQQATLQQHRRVRSLGSSNATGNERDEDLVLFHEVQKRERAAVSASITQTLQRDPSSIVDARNRAAADDIFGSSEWDKNDYDWLLTPPATPLIPNLDVEAVGHGYSLSGAASTKSVLKTTSRLGISKSEPPSRAEPVSRVLRGALGLQQPASNTPSLSSSTNSVLRKSLSSSSNGTLRPSTPSSNGRPLTPGSSGRPSTPGSNGRSSTPGSNGRSSTPGSQPATRPSTPTRTAGAPRVSTSSSSASARSSTPTGRSAMISSARAASLSGPSSTGSLTRSASSPATAPLIRSASSSTSIASTRPGGPSSRASTPVKRPTTPSRTANSSSTITLSPCVSKTSTLLPSKSAASSRPSSPASRVRQPAAHPAVLPGFSQEPPPNLRTTLPDRPLSNSRGSVASRATGTRATQPDDGARNLRGSSSPHVTRGRLSSDSVNSDKSTIRNGKSNEALQSALSNGIHSKMVDRTVSAKKPVALPEKQPAGASSLVKKPMKSSPVRDVKSATPSVRESTGFGRNLSKKSLDMALRHMDIRKNAPSSFKSFMSNVPTSSLYSVRSNNGRGLSSSSVADSPMATSSNASSEHSMSIAIDRDGSEVGDEMLSEMGSRASPISSQPDSYNERKVNSWLASPNYANGNNTDILQVFEQGIERLSSTESPLISHYEGSIECDKFTLEPIQ